MFSRGYQKIETTPREKYFSMGYSGFVSNLSRDWADNLEIHHRRDFRAGWDYAAAQSWLDLAKTSSSKSKKTPQ